MKLQEIQEMSKSALIMLRNKIEVELQARSKKEKENVGYLLAIEIANLIDGVGSNMVASDYYAAERYYSDIEGIKNIREGGNKTIIVKITAPVEIPDFIEVKGEKWAITVIESKNFSRC
jgi:hypothetical protein